MSRYPPVRCTLRNGQWVQIRRDGQIELLSHVGVFSTVKDLAVWDVALAAGKVVKQASLDQMWTPVTLADGTTRPYGFGCEVKELRGHRLISHAGITGTEYSRFPDDGLAVIVLTNLGNRVGLPRVNAWGVTDRVAGHYVADLVTSW